MIAKYLDKELGESEKVPVTDDEVVQASHEFTLECDLNSSTEIDTLISNPVECTTLTLNLQLFISKFFYSYCLGNVRFLRYFRLFKRYRTDFTTGALSGTLGGK